MRITKKTRIEPFENTVYPTTSREIVDQMLTDDRADQWRIQDFPEGAAPAPKSAIIFQFCSRKLNENERIRTPREGCIPGAPPPLDPPMQMVCEHSAVIECGTVFSAVHRVGMYSAVHTAAGLSAAGQDAVHIPFLPVPVSPFTVNICRSAGIVPVEAMERLGTVRPTA